MTARVTTLYTATERARDRRRVVATAKSLWGLADQLGGWADAEELDEFGAEGDIRGASLALESTLRRIAVGPLELDDLTSLIATGGEFMATLLGLVLMAHQAHCRLGGRDG
jgi:hypothetical protein